MHWPQFQTRHGWLLQENPPPGNPEFRPKPDSETDSLTGPHFAGCPSQISDGPCQQAVLRHAPCLLGIGKRASGSIRQTCRPSFTRTRTLNEEAAPRRFVHQVMRGHRHRDSGRFPSEASPELSLLGMRRAVLIRAWLQEKLKKLSRQRARASRRRQRFGSLTSLAFRRSLIQEDNRNLANEKN